MTKTYQERADAIAKAIGKLSIDIAGDNGPLTALGGDMNLSRTFDQIATVAGVLSATAAHYHRGAHECNKQANKVRRAVRRALGYTTP